MGLDQPLHEIQDSARMTTQCQIEKGARHASVAVEDKGRPIGSLAVEHPKRPRQFAALIGEQREGESVLVRNPRFAHIQI